MKLLISPSAFCLLPSQWLGSGLPCLLPDLGFPEFESGHLRDFSIKAQLSKSVASAIPPCPLLSSRGLSLPGINTPLFYSSINGKFMQLQHHVLSAVSARGKVSGL
jgi:hypothetical protein